MTKRQLIDAIVLRNSTATPAFLARFDEPQLHAYLDHLSAATKPLLCGDSSRFAKFFGKPVSLIATRATVASPEPDTDQTAIQASAETAVLPSEAPKPEPAPEPAPEAAEPEMAAQAPSEPTFEPEPVPEPKPATEAKTTACTALAIFASQQTSTFKTLFDAAPAAGEAAPMDDPAPAVEPQAVAEVAAPSEPAPHAEPAPEPQPRAIQQQYVPVPRPEAQDADESGGADEDEQLEPPARLSAFLPSYAQSDSDEEDDEFGATESDATPETAADSTDANEDEEAQPAVTVAAGDTDDSWLF